MREPVQDRSRDSAERVLDAVQRILAADGLAGLTTARVAAESGVSNGSIYHRFGSRGALLAGALDRFSDQVRAQAARMRAEIPEQPPTLAAAVLLLTAAYRALFEEHGGLIRAFFIDSLSEPDLADRGELAKGLFAQQLADFLAAYPHEITAPDTAAAYAMVHRLLFGYFMMRTLFHDDAGDEQMLASLGDAVLGVLAPRARP